MRVRTLWLSGVLGLALGCAASRPQTSPSPVPTTAAADSRGRIPVRIDNQNYSDLDMYLLFRGTRVLLGSVTGLTRATLMLPTRSAVTDGAVELQAGPLGGGSPRLKAGSSAAGPARGGRSDPDAAAAGVAGGAGVLDNRRGPGGLLRIGRMWLGSAGSAGAWALESRRGARTGGRGRL